MNRKKKFLSLIITSLFLLTLIVTMPGMTATVHAEMTEGTDQVGLRFPNANSYFVGMRYSPSNVTNYTGEVVCGETLSTLEMYGNIHAWNGWSNTSLYVYYAFLYRENDGYHVMGNVQFHEIRGWSDKDITPISYKTTEGDIGKTVTLWMWVTSSNQGTAMENSVFLNKINNGDRRYGVARNFTNVTRTIVPVVSGYLDLEYEDDTYLDQAKIDQTYSLNVENSYTDVTKVKLEWETKNLDVVTAHQHYTWDPDTLAWSEPTNEDVYVDRKAAYDAKFTLTNLSSVEVKANTSFAVEEDLESAYKESETVINNNNCTIGTVVDGNKEVNAKLDHDEEITVKLGINTDLFTEEQETTAFGTYTVTIQSAN